MGRLRDLEDTVRLKNKQIHQLLQDIDLMEADNRNNIHSFIYLSISLPIYEISVFPSV